jgi:hypothetical protein
MLNAGHWTLVLWSSPKSDKFNVEFGTWYVRSVYKARLIEDQ